MKEWKEDFGQIDEILNINNIGNNLFKKLVKEPNYQYIHPVKQKKIYELVQLLLKEDEDNTITDIIIFGSSTTLFCSSFSDIDIMVLGTFNNFTTNINLFEFGEVDLFGYNKEEFLKEAQNNKFYLNVWEKGVRVYEQLSAFS